MTPGCVLLVTPTANVAAMLGGWFTAAGWRVVLATSFAQANAHLDREVAILVSEVRLGDYNGLHLAIRAMADHVPAIVIGDYDGVLQLEADRLGITYLTFQHDRSELLNTIERLARPVDPTIAWIDSPDRNISFVSRADLSARHSRAAH